MSDGLINELVRTRSAIDDLKADIHALKAKEQGLITGIKALGIDVPPRMTARERVLSEIPYDQARSVRDIEKRSKVPRPQLSAQLRALIEAGKIRRVSHGLYERVRGDDDQ